MAAVAIFGQLKQNLWQQARTFSRHNLTAKTLSFALYSVEGAVVSIAERRLLEASVLDGSVSLLQAAFLIFGHKVSPAVNIIQ